MSVSKRDLSVITALIALLVVIFVIRSSSLSEQEVSLILVEGGEFVRGDDDGNKDVRPAHTVSLHDFYLSKYEITNAQYCVFLNAMQAHQQGDIQWISLGSKYARIEIVDGAYMPVRGYERHPVLEVSWYGAHAYCEWQGGRLPTEAEWEYAAAGGNESKGYRFSGSDNPNFVAWYVTTSGADTRAVGTKQPNELGFYDMSGNAWEWTADWYDAEYYSVSPTENPPGPATGDYKVIRGGSWCTFGTENLLVTSRVMAQPEYTGTTSFRLCMDSLD